MRLGVKYCGGCNPRYDRARFVARLLDEFEGLVNAPIGEARDVDLVLVVCGCPSRCAEHAALRGRFGKIVIGGERDYEVLRSLLEKSLRACRGNPVDWRQTYQERLTTAESAVRRIKSGDRVVIGHAVGEPSHLVDAMMANRARLSDVEIVHMVPMGAAEYAQPGMEAHFRHNALFVGGKTREAVKSGRADFTPCFFYEVPRLFATTLPIDVALVQVSPPDEHGYCSLGVSVDYTKRAVEAAKIVLAQVNDRMPRTMGESFVHVSRFDCVVEHSAPVIELEPPAIGPVERAIGEQCAKLIRDGDTLQLGIGAIPDAVLMSLADKRDLGIHSEMISDGVVALVEAGVVTGIRKSLHPGKIVVSFLMGTKRLYDFVDDNPMVAMYPVDYVNDPVVIMKNDNMVSINSCVQVDLMGQVASETVGATQISAVGGQVDFVRGAMMSRGGRSIIAMPSTAAKGTISKIVPLLDSGGAVTTSRNDVDYIVTEYGIAHLRGMTLRQRARELIGIAHPDFRPILVSAYEERFARRFE
jgi:4-hydroxybutyrate CoA-transferase